MRARLLTRGLVLIMLLGGCGHTGKAPSATIGSSEAPTGPGIFSAELNALCRQAQAAQMLLRPAVSGPVLVSVDARYLRRILTFRAPPSQAPLFAQFQRDAATALKRLQLGDAGGAVEIYSKSRSLATKLDAPACRRWGLEPTPLDG